MKTWHHWALLELASSHFINISGFSQLLDYHYLQQNMCIILHRMLLNIVQKEWLAYLTWHRVNTYDIDIVKSYFIQLLFWAYSIPLYLHLQFISSYYKYWFENHLYGNVDIILAPKTLVIHDKLINGWKGKIRCKNMSKSCRQTVSFFFFFKHIIKSIQFSGGDKLWKDGWINLLSTPAI